MKKRKSSQKYGLGHEKKSDQNANDHNYVCVQLFWSDETLFHCGHAMVKQTMEPVKTGCWSPD